MDHAKWSPVCTASYRLMPEVTVSEKVGPSPSPPPPPSPSLTPNSITIPIPIVVPFQNLFISPHSPNVPSPSHHARHRHRHRHCNANTITLVIVLQVTGKLAKHLKKLCPRNVFDIENIEGAKPAVPTRPRDCTLCRECIREPEWADRVQLRRIRNHFICGSISISVPSPSLSLS